MLNGADDNRDNDNYPVAKLIAEDKKAMWLLIDIDPDDSDFAFALYDSGERFPEFIYVSLPLLKDASNKMKFDVIQDEAFKAKYPISVYAKAARLSGFITEDDKVLAPIAKAQEGLIITSSMAVVDVDIRPKVEAFCSANKLMTKKKVTPISSVKLIMFDQCLTKIKKQL